MYTNCDTLTNKIYELKFAKDSNDLDIIVLSEVTPKNNRYILQKSEIEIKGYNSYISSVCEKFQATRAKVAPVKLIYGSHFSSTEAIYEVSQNIDFFLYNHYIYKR